ncbi:hypothetical protein AAVH_10207 [Aphelenchoides avenae]|nr:hypothetical protein AAVH_10207 [Aphelenchus avenae]
MNGDTKKSPISIEEQFLNSKASDRPSQLWLSRYTVLSSFFTGPESRVPEETAPIDLSRKSSVSSIKSANPNLELLEDKANLLLRTLTPQVSSLPRSSIRR